MADGEIPCDEMLEEMLKRGEQELFPKLRRKAERFVDAFNHQLTQNMIVQKWTRFNQELFDAQIESKMEDIRSARTVFDMLKTTKVLFAIFKKFSEQINTTSLLEQVHQTGFFALVTDENFNFLDDQFSVEESARGLIKLLEEGPQVSGRNDAESAVNEYLENVPHPLRAQVRQQMKLEAPEADKKATEILEFIVNDFLLAFEPLKSKLGTVTDNDLKRFLQVERLEEDYEYIDEALRNWLINIAPKVPVVVKPRQLKISKDLIMKETNRLSKLLYAIALNKPATLAEHKSMVLDLVKSASDEKSSDTYSLLPCISFGQLPLRDGESSPSIDVTFVLPSILSESDGERILKDLEVILGISHSGRVDRLGGARVLKVKLPLHFNASYLLASNIKRLSDLSIRAVLVGNFGFSGFRNAMNPAYNKIYSNDGTVHAEGFETTCFSSLDRGGEPYFCPNGWRRYAIDVGLTGPKFERAYHDWPVAYHGTAGHVAMAILLNGLKASMEGCHLSNGEGRVYLSPSIEYCGHPRYAPVWKVRNKYVQMVLQVRVKKSLITKKGSGTLPGAEEIDAPMDPNFSSNKTLEWIVKWAQTHINTMDGIVVYGLMLRVTDDHPIELAQNAWWGEVGRVICELP